MNFLIQTVEGKFRHDFAFHLYHAIDRQNWLAGEIVHTAILSDSIEGHPNCIPVGSLDFIFEYLECYYQIDRKYVQPLNVPTSLRTREFLGRDLMIAKKEDIVPPKRGYLFVKSNTQYKKFMDAIKDTSILPEDEYLVSEMVDIDSEYRAFVQQGELLDIRNYSGDFKVFPDIPAVKRMIEAYKDAPLSYTLDIGMVNGDCIVIEVHPFVSCGLYGFENDSRLPSMFIQGFHYFKKEAKKLQYEKEGEKVGSNL